MSVRGFVAALPVIGELESSVESNETSAEEENATGDHQESHRQGGSIINQLVADHGIEHEHPSGTDNGANVNRSEGLSRMVLSV